MATAASNPYLASNSILSSASIVHSESRGGGMQPGSGAVTSVSGGYRGDPAVKMVQSWLHARRPWQPVTGGTCWAMPISGLPHCHMWLPAAAAAAAAAEAGSHWSSSPVGMAGSPQQQDVKNSSNREDLHSGTALHHRASHLGAHQSHQSAWGGTTASHIPTITGGQQQSQQSLIYSSQVASQSTGCWTLPGVLVHPGLMRGDSPEMDHHHHHHHHQQQQHPHHHHHQQHHAGVNSHDSHSDEDHADLRRPGAVCQTVLSSVGSNWVLLKPTSG